MAASYWDSTQRRFWEFTKEQLGALRQRRQDEERSLVQRCPLPEQRHLNMFFFQQLNRLGKRMSVRQQALATAQVYMKRFYLRVELCRTNPYLVMATVLYLACKTEECPQHIRQVVQEAKALWPDMPAHCLEISRVGECEFFIISELRSQLIVHAPYRTLLSLQGELGLHPDELAHAWNIVNDHYMTDLPLLYPPHVIAVTALLWALVLPPGGGAGGAGAAGTSGTAGATSSTVTAGMSAAMGAMGIGAMGAMGGMGGMGAMGAMGAMVGSMTNMAGIAAGASAGLTPGHSSSLPAPALLTSYSSLSSLGGQGGANTPSTPGGGNTGVIPGTPGLGVGTPTTAGGFAAALAQAQARAAAVAQAGQVGQISQTGQTGSASVSGAPSTDEDSSRATMLQWLVKWLADSGLDMEAIIDCTQELISFYVCSEEYNEKLTREQINRFVKLHGLDR